MRRTLTTILVALAVIAGVGGLAIASSGGSDASRARLERALPVAFGNQYVHLAHLLGHDEVTAGGPSKLIGYATITDKQGHPVTNPAFEFDGCFDPRGDNSPTGVFYPSVLNVSSTVLQVDADRNTSVQMTCGTGAEGCAGTVTATAGKATLGTVPFKVQEEGIVTVPFPRAVPAGAQQVTVSTRTTKGVPAKAQTCRSSPDGTHEGVPPRGAAPRIEDLGPLG